MTTIPIPTSRLPRGVALLPLFFSVATCILVACGTALLFPGSLMEVVWRAYPARRAMLMPYREWLGPGFLILAIAMLFASVGCSRRRIWGWRLAVGIFAVNGIGDVGQIFLGHFVEGTIGVSAAGTVLYYLFLSRVRSHYI